MRNWLLGVSVAAVLCHASVTYALDGQEVLAEYSVTTWVGTDGFSFGDANAIAQDKSGYLWLGTSVGLVRFDGVRFVPWKIEGVPLDTYVSALHASSDGSLWVGLSTGIVRIRGEVATDYTSRQGFRGALAGRIVEERDGTIWAGGAEGLWRFRDDRWEQVLAQQGFTARASSALFIDPEGVLWVGTSEGIFRRNPRENMFQQVTKPTSFVTAIAADSFGSLWATDPVRSFVTISNGPSLAGWPGRGFGPATEILGDRHGNMWVGTPGQGVLRLRPIGRRYEGLEQVTRKEGLAANAVRALFEDREGNIWIGMTGGLTRLSERTVTSLAEGEAVSALIATDDGSIWVGTNAGLIRLTGRRQQRYTVQDGLPSDTIRALHAGNDGTLWVATSQGPARLVGRRFRSVPLPDGSRLQRITAITTQGDGAVWFTDLDDGLFRFADGIFTAVDGNRLQRSMAVYADTAGRVWIGQLSGDVAVYENGRLSFHSAADGSNIGTVTTIYEDSHGYVWFGTTTGLGRFEDGRFIREDIEDIASGVLAIAQDDHSHLWISTRAGILRASFTEPTNSVGGSSVLTDFRVYNASDGLPGIPVRAMPSAVRGLDGTLWFATANGAARISPQQLTEPSVDPAVRIESVIADDRDLKPESQQKLPAGTSRIEIQYTLLTLTSASSGRFLYKMDGYDRDWVRAGRRREAVYTNLPPGRYRFRVTSLGEALRQEDVWDFAIEPRFYQTRSFAVLGAGLLILLISAAWRLRLLHVRNQFKAVLAERARIAREIHDTVLQGLFGVALQVDGISKQLESSPEGTRERLEAVRRSVSRYIRETRSSIWLLRSPSLEERNLPAAIREAAETLTAGTPVHLEFDITGPVRPLANGLEEQVLRIVHEAIMNVVKHAQASVIHLTLRYEPESVCLRVSDNGCGFDTERVATTERARWGLVGMSERARQVGARLKLSSAVGRGTEVELVCPS